MRIHNKRDSIILRAGVNPARTSLYAGEAHQEGKRVFFGGMVTGAVCPSRCARGRKLGEERPHHCGKKLSQGWKKEYNWEKLLPIPQVINLIIYRKYMAESLNFLRRGFLRKILAVLLSLTGLFILFPGVFALVFYSGRESLTVNDMERKYRIYVASSYNGTEAVPLMMVQRLACELPGQFAVVAAVSATLTQIFFSRLQPTRCYFCDANSWRY